MEVQNEQTCSLNKKHLKVPSIQSCRSNFNFIFILGRELSVSANESESVPTTDESGFSNSSRKPKSSSPHGPLASVVYGMFKPRRDIIPRMLASKHSLLNMCLRRGKYSQAEQVVKVRTNLNTRN